MNEKQIQQALQEIAAEHIPNNLDLWPQIAAKATRSYRFPIRQWGDKLVGTAVAILALLLFASWFLSISQSTRIDEPLSSIAEPDPSPFSFTIDPQLVYPNAPVQLPRYQIEMKSPPQTMEAILEWAQTFGIPDPKLFLDPRSSEQVLAVGSDGSRLIFPAPGQNQGGIGYLRDDWTDLSPGETISFDAGAAAAQSFLAQHQQLPTDYQIIAPISRHFSANGHPARIIQFTPGLHGYPVLQSAAMGVGAALTIDSTGTVVSAGFAEGNFTEIDRVNIRPAEEVIAEFVNGRLAPLATEYMPAYSGWGDVIQYQPPLPQHTIGEEITILETDDTHFLVAEDGSEIRATLATRVGNKYQLITSDLAQIIDRIDYDTGYDELRITGTIDAQLSPDTWRLIVDTWEILPQQALYSGCVIGPVTIDTSSVWVIAEETIGDAVRKNGRYYLENLPSAIQNGDRIEACGEPMPEANNVLPWSIIYAPPRDLSQDNYPVTDKFVIDSVQLVYFYDMDDSALPFTMPVWMISGHSPDNNAHYLAYLDATH